MTIGLKGLFTPQGPEDRDIVYLEVQYNGQVYDWAAYIPHSDISHTITLGEALSAMEQKIYDEIDYKEAQWAALDPKTKTIFDPITNQEETVPIQKEEIVKPDMPDYYALRRGEYPQVGDQLDAIAKGIESVEYQEILSEIQAVKTKYPKPPYV